jgi:CheY-like chemotaxis protein
MHSKHKILLVGNPEEHVPIRSDYLATFGYSVGMASTGADALQQIEAEPLDLVIINEPLPDTSGHELCHRIRQLPSTDSPTIVLIVEFNKISGQMKKMKLVADEILAKPIHQALLLTRIEALLRTRVRVRKLHEDAAQLKKRNRALETQLEKKIPLQDVPRILKDLGDHFKKESAHVFSIAFLLKSEFEDATGNTFESNKVHGQSGMDQNLVKLSFKQLQQSVREIQDVAKAMKDFAQTLVIPSQFESCQVAEFVEGLLARLRHTAEEKQIRLKAEGLYDLPAIQADEKQLLEALYYISMQVISHLSPGSSLRFRGERLPGDKVIRLSVEGSGGGAPSDSLGYMVEGPGFTGIADVAGLGGMISKQLIESHGGSIKSTTKEPDTKVQGVNSSFEIMGSPYSTVCICLPINPRKFSPVCVHCSKETREECFSTRGEIKEEYVSPLSLTSQPRSSEGG